MSRPGIEPGSQELASCAITARPPKRYHRIPSQSFWRVSGFLLHTACTCRPPALFQVQPERKKSLLAQASPALQPLPLAFCQLPIVSGLIIWPLRRRRRQTSRLLEIMIFFFAEHFRVLKKSGIMLVIVQVFDSAGPNGSYASSRSPRS